MARKKRLGVGANCSVLLKYLHPAKYIDETYVNYDKKKRLEDCTAYRQEVRTVNRKEQVVILLRHDDHTDREIYACRRWVKVVTEGAIEHIFDNEDGPDIIPAVEQTVQEGEALSEVVFQSSGQAEDVALIRSLGLDVDDDNMPAPENIPEQASTTGRRNDSSNVEEGWGWNGIDHRKQINISNVRASIAGVSSDVVENMSFVGMFFILFPKSMVKIIIEETNKRLDEPMNMGEFIRWIGVCLLLSTLSGYKRSDFWSMKPIEMFSGAPYRFHEFMTSTRFEAIMSSLTFTKRKAPAYKDRFWQVREMIETWNHHMSENFKPSWASCLDESMSIWFNKFTCPGWVFCPRKPHPYGNEYHTICCGHSGILFAMEMVEGKDTPKERSVDPNENKIGKTGALLLRLCQSIFTTGKVVILDSGFCVLRAIIGLRQQGVFASALIKKRKYWPKYVPGEAMNEHMASKQVGECDSLKGTLDGVPYDLFTLKEPDYTMKLMSTYGGLIVPKNQKISKRVWKERGETKTTTFQYTEPFANHFYFRHAVDDHNNLRHGLPSIESTIVTHHWPLRVFTFLLAVTEVNIFKAFSYFVWSDDQVPASLVKFRRRLANAFIHNEYLKTERPRSTKSTRNKRKLEHTLVTAPCNASKFVGGRWKKTSRAKYQQFVCRGENCKKQVRTYCACMVGHWLCKECHLEHILSSIN